MTPPQRLAPDDVPLAAAHYLDNAVAFLRAVAETHHLELRPYDMHQPGAANWLHGLYGTANDRNFCIQVVTDDALATEFRAHVHAWVRLYFSDERNEWLRLETFPVAGMDQLVRHVAWSTLVLRIACVLRMPHPTDPDPKA